MTANLAQLSRGAIVGGHFRLEHVLGQGGMGVVWLAHDLRLGRWVAVKFLGAAAMGIPLERMRFAREARIAGRIRSPHVAQVFADGTTADDVPFLVMELLDGESLAAHLARAGRCTIASAGAVLEQVCRALTAAHGEGFVHRDVKPANIFLTPQPGAEVFVRVLDFGIAKELKLGPSGLTKAGELLGTASYMSPEQLRAPDAVSGATDVWSLGVVLYEMLTGELPFNEDTFPALALRITEGQFVPASQVCRDLPPAVDDVFARALATQLSRRYTTVNELRSAFLRIVRAHTSGSVVRPDVLRALQSHADTLPASERSQRSPETTQRMYGVLLVIVCGLVVFLSWLASGRIGERQQQPEVSDAPAARAGPLQPSAAEDTQLAPTVPVTTPVLPAMPDARLETAVDAVTRDARALAPAPSKPAHARSRRADRRQPSAGEPMRTQRRMPELDTPVPHPPPSAAQPTSDETMYGF